MNSKLKVRFNRSSLEGRELEYIFKTISDGTVSGDQEFSKRCEGFLQDHLGVGRALVTGSCTQALELAALLLEIKEGDEVIVPAFTFVSTANAFVVRGAIPIFCDIRSDTLNLDENKLENLITQRTKAIIPVHYSGVGCEMDEILAIANRYRIAVVEDNAHGLFGKYKGRWLGTMGTFGTQSFHETKNITSGEGGALLINDHRYVARAEILREKGTNRAAFFSGQVDKYSWIDIGGSYLMSDVLAAFLFGQLERWKRVQKKRNLLWTTYHQQLAEWAVACTARQPVVPEYCDQAWHMYYLLLPSEIERNRFIRFLKQRGIESVFHYLPLHLSPFGKQWGGKPGDCPIAEDLSARLVRLPFYNSLSSSDQYYVIKNILEFDAEPQKTFADANIEIPVV